MLCPHCGKECMEGAAVCLGCGRKLTKPVNESDKVSIGLCILAFLVPLFGVIYWGVKRDEVPKKAKACGITAVVSWVLNIILIVAFYVIMFMLGLEIGMDAASAIMEVSYATF